MNPYRRISMPKCPYCEEEVQYNIWDNDTTKLVNMATGKGSSDVMIKCKGCGKDYRVTCSIRFYGRKVRDR